ncbi:CRE_collapsed_G0021060.mRNA.1.CDS.1 [Saccharomyces cerevisiae]|nr:CRE_collapsed_G0021060.mRNA.1.CDS.1 [Saccharomyces cerevisiae]
MRIIKGRKRGKNKKPTLILKIHVIQAENIEALKTFNCNPSKDEQAQELKYTLESNFEDQTSEKSNI